MSYVLDITTTDTYQYLECPGSTDVTMIVSNNKVAVGFGTENPLGKPKSGVYPPADEVFIPVAAGLDRQCDEIRVKSYTPGLPAVVHISAR